MKKIILVLLLLVVWAVPAHAIGLMTHSASDTFELFSSATPAVGTVKDLKYTTDQFTCHITQTGTAPTDMLFHLMGSGNNTTFGIMAAHTYTYSATAKTNADNGTFTSIDKSARYIGCDYVSKNGGDGTTVGICNCRAGAN